MAVLGREPRAAQLERSPRVGARLGLSRAAPRQAPPAHDRSRFRQVGHAAPASTGRTSAPALPRRKNGRGFRSTGGRRGSGRPAARGATVPHPAPDRAGCLRARPPRARLLAVPARRDRRRRGRRRAARKTICAGRGLTCTTASPEQFGHRAALRPAPRHQPRRPDYPYHGRWMHAPVAASRSRDPRPRPARSPAPRARSRPRSPPSGRGSRKTCAAASLQRHPHGSSSMPSGSTEPPSEEGVRD